VAKTLKISPSLDGVLKRIKEVITDKQSRRRLLLRAVLELKDLTAAYPVAGAWNSAPGAKGDGQWYQRNFGTRYSRKDGTTGGRNTSQKLQKNWRTEIQRKDEFSASVFTEVTYAPFLLDPTKRVHWAAGHGWQSLDEIEKDYMPRFEKLALEEIDKQIKKI